MPSQTRFSSVPRCGAGRRSQRTSDIESMIPVVVWSAMHFSNSAHVSKVNGSPAVGSCWNISARLEAYPVSWPAQIGELAERARRWGYVVSIEASTGITRSRSGIPTWTCTPQISIWRPHHWVRLISSA